MLQQRAKATLELIQVILGVIDPGANALVDGLACDVLACCQCDWAMVAGPTRGYLWILAREARLDQVRIDTLMEKARELKFPIEEPVSVDHSAIDCRTEN